ncbi:hypothetical protein M9Y10_018935 [Tritrichomonas musculus]|uniref:Surface antigen BspA-like protein n=1 Tax=Tritrichomonas musculus TaxID=1915356 RepID=A0ABR2HI52_9EUKA
MPNNPNYMNVDNSFIVSKTDPYCTDYTNLIFVNRSIKKVIIPSFITQIKSYAFSECSIEKVFIPSHIKKIYEGSFYKCKFLQQVEIPPDSELEIIEKLSFFETAIENYFVPPSFSLLGENWCNKSTKITTSIKPPIENGSQMHSILIKDGKCSSIYESVSVGATLRLSPHVNTNS